MPTGISLHAQPDIVAVTRAYPFTASTPKSNSPRPLVQVLLYLAKAHYDARRMIEARRALQRALHVTPGDTTLLFNLAFTLQQEVMLGLKTFSLKDKVDKALVWRGGLAWVGRAHVSS